MSGNAQQGSGELVNHACAAFSLSSLRLDENRDAACLAALCHRGGVIAAFHAAVSHAVNKLQFIITEIDREDAYDGTAVLQCKNNAWNLVNDFTAATSLAYDDAVWWPKFQALAEEVASTLNGFVNPLNNSFEELLKRLLEESSGSSAPDPELGQLQKIVIFVSQDSSPNLAVQSALGQAQACARETRRQFIRLRAALRELERDVSTELEGAVTKLATSSSVDQS